MKIKPLCHPYWYNDDGTKEINPRPKSTEYTARGNIVPCCWCEAVSFLDEMKQFGMFDDEIKVENVKSVKEIYMSKQWVNFHRTLILDQENAPNLCKMKCGESKYSQFLPEDLDEYMENVDASE